MAPRKGGYPFDRYLVVVGNRAGNRASRCADGCALFSVAVARIVAYSRASSAANRRARQGAASAERCCGDHRHESRFQASHMMPPNASGLKRTAGCLVPEMADMHLKHAVIEGESTDRGPSQRVSRVLNDGGRDP